VCYEDFRDYMLEQTKPNLQEPELPARCFATVVQLVYKHPLTEVGALAEVLSEIAARHLQTWKAYQWFHKLLAICESFQIHLAL
jgi:hypothetical protein